MALKHPEDWKDVHIRIMSEEYERLIKIADEEKRKPGNAARYLLDEGMKAYERRKAVK